MSSNKTAPNNVPYIQLDRVDTKGPQMPQVGLGTWKSDGDIVTKIVKSAIVDSGYRHIDCACDYGNEQQVGEGIKQALSEDTSIKRSDIFVTSKLWNTYHKKEHVKPALLKTLKDLQLDYLDLYLIHFPISLKYVPIDYRYPPEWVHDPKSSDENDHKVLQEYIPIMETWRELENLVNEGYIRYIGVSNFPVILIMQILASCNIQPSVLQCELHPYLQQNELLAFCRRSNIQVTAFSQFASISYQSLGMDDGDDVFAEPIVIKLSEKYNKSKAQILLKWAVQRNTLVIPKTSKVERLSENIDLFADEWNLEDEEMNEINKLNRNKRYNDPGQFVKMMGVNSDPIPIYN